MANPVLLIVAPAEDGLSMLERDVREAHGTDLDVRRANSTSNALAALQSAKGNEEPVALVLVDDRTPSVSVREFLEEAAALYPDAKRVVVTAGGEPDQGEETKNGLRIDAFLSRTAAAAENSLLPVLRDLLDEWRAECQPRSTEVRVLGFQWSPQAHEVKDFLARNRVPYVWSDVEHDRDARRLAEEAGADLRELPLLIFPDGSRLTQPTDAEVAEKIGLSTEAESPFYDLIIVGGGPAGLAAAVYGASEGLRTIILEKEAPGGQAGQSARIENYLGFPDGLSGGELAQRAVAQAKRFGVEILAARPATALRPDGRYHVITLDNGNELTCHAMLLSVGVSWRILDAPGCTALVGAGVYYGAASAEAAAFRDQDVYVLGGGNSAGQAVMLLSRYARTVTMLVLEETIEERMSAYLIERIRATPNIEVRTGSTVIEAHGEGRLEEITIQDVASGKTEQVIGNALFVFIGASPQTDWLEGAVERDEQGFILSGDALPRENGRPPNWRLKRQPFMLETSVPGVFVAGDVRAGSVKRVASAVGEGSMAVQFIHQHLKDR